MGLGTQMVAWQEDFCAAARRHGACTWCASTTATSGARPICRDRRRSLAQLLRALRQRRPLHARRHGRGRGRACLSELELAPAHVIGASMGGMIAQTLAARHPQQVRSLVSIMSNTGSAGSGPAGAAQLSDSSSAARRASATRSSRTPSACSQAIGSRGLPQRPDGHPRARRTQLRPRPRPRRAPGASSPRSSPPATAPRSCAHHRADARDPRHSRPARVALRRPGHRSGDPRRQADDDRGHGPRSAARALAASDQRLRHTRGRGGRACREPFSAPASLSRLLSPATSVSDVPTHHIVRPAGIEPAACGLKDRCSLAPRREPLTTELRARAGGI